jgi:hypothetical protein
MAAISSFDFLGTWTCSALSITYTNLSLKYNLSTSLYTLTNSEGGMQIIGTPTFDYNTLGLVCRFSDTVGGSLIYLELGWNPNNYSLTQWDEIYENEGESFTFGGVDSSFTYTGPNLPYIYFPSPPQDDTISKTTSELLAISSDANNLGFQVFPPLSGNSGILWNTRSGADWSTDPSEYTTVDVNTGLITYIANGTTKVIVTLPAPSREEGRYGNNVPDTDNELTFYLQVTSSGANSNICFVAGTPVKTDQGLIPIEQLDHTVNTIDGQHIVAITKITSTDSYLIRIPKDHLGENAPDTETIISQLHKVLYNGVMTRAKQIPGVSKVDYDGQPLYNVLLDTYGTMIVNNLTVETLHPQANVAVLYKHITTNNLSDVERDKMIKVFNKRLALGDDLRKAFFENIVLIIMLDILLEPKCDVEVTQYSLLKAFVPQCCPVKLVEQPLALC